MKEGTVPLFSSIYRQKLAFNLYEHYFNKWFYWIKKKIGAMYVVIYMA